MKPNKNNKRKRRQLTLGSKIKLSCYSLSACLLLTFGINKIGYNNIQKANAYQQSIISETKINTVEYAENEEVTYSNLFSCMGEEEPVKNTRAITAKATVKSYTGYINATELNIRSKPNTSSKVLGRYKWNQKVTYTKYNKNWYKVKYNNKTGYISSKYIKAKKVTSKTYSVPIKDKQKSFMDYKTITLKSSAQYKLQKKAYTGKYGIRMVNGRYMIALGSGYTKKIGQYVDLVLNNGTVIPCILGDQKNNIHTDSSNRYTLHDKSVVEFIVNTKSLSKTVRYHGNIKYATSKWNSSIKKVIVYNKSI